MPVVAGDKVYHILGQNPQQELIKLGELNLADEGSAQRYRIEWDEAKFENHFLSMRPFKCLSHPVQLICHLPYPYEINRRISDSDLTDLEYDMLFLHKTPQEYGINAWNGLYYQFRRTENGFAGELRETDLNVLQAPPEEGDLRPIDPDALYQPSDKHWLRRILIEQGES
ncbi:MAG: hypothetical protein ABW098_12580 [Candidatus Thiodiazotropha sp.]